MSDSSDVLAAMRSDHGRIEALLADAVVAIGGGDPQAIGPAWTKFSDALVGHLALEERHLIPGLLRKDERAARSILEEHRHIRTRLAELTILAKGNALLPASSRAFVADLRAHARHEEGQLYATEQHELSEFDRKGLPAPPVEAGPANTLSVRR